MEVTTTGDNAVTRWFGPRFAELHPLLQELHRHGGRLRGSVDIRTGRGLAGWLGRRLAVSLGIPLDQPHRGFAVTIGHRAGVLDWIREFDDGTVMASHFEPIGMLPQGYWRERTGPLALDLTVDIVERGWEWQPLRASFHGIRLPLWLLPRSRAGKRIEDGRYVFSVEFALPLVGVVLYYGGRLHADPRP